MMEAQFDTGATHDTRILIAGWALAGKAPDTIRAIAPTRRVVNARIHCLPQIEICWKLSRCSHVDEYCLYKFQSYARTKTASQRLTMPSTICCSGHVRYPGWHRRRCGHHSANNLPIDA